MIMNLIEFVEKYVCMRNKKDGSVEKLKLREYQKNILEMLENKRNKKGWES